MTTSSFQRKTGTTKPKLSGTKSDGQDILISTGVPTLDRCIGGGVAVGSILLIEEDQKCVYSQLLSKYFIGEGISHQHKVFLYSSDVPSDLMIKSLPSVVEKERPVRVPDVGSNEPLKIAWRYQQVQLVSPLSGSQIRSFDWNKPVSEEALSQIASYDGEPSYADILCHLANKLQTHNPVSQVLRVVIHGLGSPIWEDEENVFKFLYSLRCLCRSYNATCLVTTPSYWLHQESSRAHHVRRLSDVSIHLNVLQEHEKKQRPHLKDYNGVLYIHRIRRPNSFFVRTIGNTRDLAFSVKRKNFVVEEIHLPPALDEAPTIKTAPRNLCSTRPGTSILDF